jgi:ElaA protein
MKGPMTVPITEPAGAAAAGLRWHDRAFGELTARELHAIYALRVRVFVVEQACAYQEVDELDLQARHVWAEADGRIAAYLRIIPAGAKYDEVCIGRVVTAPEARGTGLARELMRRALALTGGAPLRLAAQAYLERFYVELGFVRASDVFDEDGILHVEMTRPGA